MFPLTCSLTYNTPDEYQIPEDLVRDIKYANLNSRDYAKRMFNRQLRINSAWECVSTYDQEHIAIATNKLSGREWTGSVWSMKLEHLDQLTADNICFKLQCNAIITRLLFVSANMLLVGMQSGKIQIWSTQSEVRNPKNPYCLFLIGEKCEHNKGILCLESVKKDSNQFVSGCRDGTIKIWDIGGADLVSTVSLRFAHSEAITGIDTSAYEESIFATCSLDKTALLWDNRLNRPAIALFANHTVRFRDVKWSCLPDSVYEHTLYLADESGFLHAVDSRSPNKFVGSEQHFDRPIRKIQIKGSNLAMISDTNSAKVYNTKIKEVIYQDNKAQSIVRDCVWRNAEELLAVGFDSKFYMHKIPK